MLHRIAIFTVQNDRGADGVHASNHVQGMQKNEQDNDVRLAATTALFNALEFAHSNFNNDSERNYLMQAGTKRLLLQPCV